MTNKEARELLKQLEDRGTIENNLSMDQIYALRVAQGALDDIAECKRLLKLAVKDFNKSLGAMYTCPYCKYVNRKREVCGLRKEQYCGDICEWRYADEALKLIREDGERDDD